MTAAGSLFEEIQDRVAGAGPMTFESFMRLALYHPRHGYYATRVPGQGGDYGTSPSVSPWFGRFVARGIARLWEVLGRPDPFTVVEVGPGRGDLAAGALGAPEVEGGPLGEALRWRFVERFDAVADLQRARLTVALGGAGAARLEWSPHLGGPPAAAGCVLAHEVLDNFPVHLLEVGAGGVVREVYVTAPPRGPGAPARLGECLGPLSDGALEEPARQAASLPPGSRFEVCTDLAGWCHDAGQAIARGYLLVIDYGDRQGDLRRDNPRGTVVTYGPDGFGEDPLADPGLRDVTADVDFSAVSFQAVRSGFAPYRFTTQREWLTWLGLDEFAAGVEAAAEAAWAEGAHATALAAEEDLGLLRTLAARLGFGDIMVFLAGKHAPDLPGMPGMVPA